MYSIFEREIRNNSTVLICLACTWYVLMRERVVHVLLDRQKATRGGGIDDDDDDFANVRGRSEISRKLGYDVIVLVWTQAGRVVALL